MVYSKLMMPFNHLGPIFKVFASLVYPGAFRDGFAEIVRKTSREGRVLDIGSGTGILSQFACAARNDLRYILIDPAPGMLRFAPDFAEKVVGTAEFLPFPQGYFDLLLVGDAFHHFKDPAQAMREMARVMEDDAICVIFEIDPGSRLGALIAWGESLLGEPAHFFKPEELSQIFAKHGFQSQPSRYGWRYSILARRIAR